MGRAGQGAQGRVSSLRVVEAVGGKGGLLGFGLLSVCPSVVARSLIFGHAQKDFHCYT